MNHLNQRFSFVRWIVALGLAASNFPALAQEIPTGLRSSDAQPAEYDQDRPRKRPFQFTADVELSNNEPVDSVDVPIPAGKRLVVEHVSLDVFIPTGQKPVFNIFGNLGPELGAGLQPVATLVASQGGVDIYNTSQPATLFTVSFIRLVFGRLAVLPGDARARFSIIGHLEPRG